MTSGGWAACLLLSNTDTLACRWEPWCLVNTGMMSKKMAKISSDQCLSHFKPRQLDSGGTVCVLKPCVLMQTDMQRGVCVCAALTWTSWPGHSGQWRCRSWWDAGDRPCFWGCTVQRRGNDRERHTGQKHSVTTGHTFVQSTAAYKVKHLSSEITSL